MSETNPAATAEVAAPHRYTAAMAADIEARWQDFWDAEGTYEAPNPSGDLAGDPEQVAKPKKFIMDMFPYPSGAGLHVGHPLGYIATDVFARFQRMTGHNVLHTLGFDAFGLPAEQYAVQTGTHPRVVHRGQHRQHEGPAAPAGPGPRQAPVVRHDRPGLLQVDPVDLPADLQLLVRRRRRSKARPIADLVAQFETGERAVRRRAARAWSELSAVERADVLGEYRLAYASDAPVNWCPGLGTVLANEEVTADGRSERGNFPVFKAKLRQWNMRITAYADRLLDDLDGAGLARGHQAAAAQLDRPLRGRPRRLPAWTASTSRSSPPARTPCSAPPTWCWRPSTRWSRSSRPGRLARGHPRGVDRRPRDPGRGRRRLPRAGRLQVGRRAAGRGQGQDRRLHRRVRHQPGQRRADPGLHRRLRADGLRHRRDHGRPGARPAATSRSRAPSSCRSAASSSRPTAAAPTPRRGTTPSSRTTRRSSTPPTTTSPWTAWASPRPRRGSPSGWRSRASARAPSTSGCATGCSAASATGASPSRSSTTRTASPTRCPSRCCRWSCPRSRTTRRAPSTRTTPTPCPETPLSRNEDWVERHPGPGRRPRPAHVPPRDQHHAQLGRFLLVRAALPGPAQRREAGRPGRSSSTGWARARACRTAASTCTWAAPSTPCCTCCTRASGPRCCTTWGTSPRPSRSTSCTTRA